MYIQRNHTKGKNGKTYSATLLCSKYREGGKVKTKVVANLSALSESIILGIENMLKFDKHEVVLSKEIKVSKSFDYGYFFVIHEIMKRLRIDSIGKNITKSSIVPRKSDDIGKDNNKRQQVEHLQLDGKGITLFKYAWNRNEGFKGRRFVQFIGRTFSL